MSLPSNKRQSSDDLDKDLQKIYANPEGKMPDLKSFEASKHNRLVSAMLWAGFFALALAGVSWIGYMVFLRAPSFTGDRAMIQIDSPDTLTAGAETDIVLAYRNDERIPLASATLSAELPKEFVEISSDPPRNEGGQWPVGTVVAGGSGRVTIKGWTRKEPGTTLTFRSTLTYKPADFNSQFQKVVSRTIPVEGSALTVSATGTSEVVPGDKADFIFDVENTSERTQDKLEFRLTMPDGFVYASAEPKAGVGVAGHWNLGSLTPHAKTKVTVHGTFSTDARGPKELLGSAGYPNEDGSFAAIASASATTDVQKSAVSVSMVVNGSSNAPAVSFGDTLYFSLNWKNSGDTHLKEVTLSAELLSKPDGVEMLDWISLKDEAGGTRKGDTLTWTSKQVPDLANLAPDAQGTINFSLPLVKKPPALSASATSTMFAVAASARAKLPKAGKIPARDVVSSPINIQLNSDTVFKAYGRYYDESGVPLGSGPIPPKAGQTTTYRIFWVISNTLHELSNLTVSTVLPQGVKSTGAQRQVDAGSLTFDSTGRQATWQLNKLPTSVHQVIVSFDVQATPSLQDEGEIMPLTGDNRFEALDKATQAVILKTEQTISTDLVGDETAAGKGIVRE